jgi:hypothetical protein
LGGWLLFFWIIITVVGPLAVARVAARSSDPLNWVLLVGTAGIGIYAGILIYKEDHKALDVLRILFVVQLLGAAAMLLRTPDNRVGWQSVNAAIYVRAAVKVVWVGIWWLYFRTSDRVRNTFSRNI